MYSASSFTILRLLSFCRLRPLAVVCCIAWGVVARAEVQPAHYGEDFLATSATRELPSTGVLTAKQIGDGVWWKPVLNETSVTQVLDDLERWNIPNLYVDVFRSGHTLFPSKTFPQRADAADRDWLKYIIQRAHARNIRVHAWIQVLCWQDAEDSHLSTASLYSKKPEWLEVSADGFAVDGKTKARFVSPGVPGVRDALVDLVREISRYDVDGINLDAVAYNTVVDTGYNAYVVSEFTALHEVDPAELKIDRDEDSDWMKWVMFREDKLTSVVQLLSEAARETAEIRDRRILISAAVQPGYEDTRGLNRRYQHWQQWLEENLVDATMPQCFNPELAELEQQLWEARSMHMGSTVACMPGLKVQDKPSGVHPPLQDQKRLLRSAGFEHCTVLDYDGLKYAMENPQSVEPEARRGFWYFLRDQK